jgi:hypothetical protein
MYQLIMKAQREEWVKADQYVLSYSYIVLRKSGVLLHSRVAVSNSDILSISESYKNSECLHHNEMIMKR